MYRIKTDAGEIYLATEDGVINYANQILNDMSLPNDKDVLDEVGIKYQEENGIDHIEFITDIDVAIKLIEHFDNYVIDIGELDFTQDLILISQSEED